MKKGKLGQVEGKLVQTCPVRNPLLLLTLLILFLLTGQVSSKIRKVLLVKIYREVFEKRAKPALKKNKNHVTCSGAKYLMQGKLVQTCPVLKIHIDFKIFFIESNTYILSS